MEVKLRRVDRIYRPGETVDGLVVVTSRGGWSHMGINLRVLGQVGATVTPTHARTSRNTVNRKRIEEKKKRQFENGDKKRKQENASDGSADGRAARPPPSKHLPALQARLMMSSRSAAAVEAMGSMKVGVLPEHSSYLVLVLARAFKTVLRCLQPTTLMDTEFQAVGAGQRRLARGFGARRDAKPALPAVAGAVTQRRMPGLLLIAGHGPLLASVLRRPRGMRRQGSRRCLRGAVHVQNACVGPS